MAVMKFGIGRWGALNKSGILPHKCIGLCYLQLQRLLAQQSLAGFMGLHVDIDHVFKDNMAKTNVARKFGYVIINAGDKVTPEEKQKLLAENREKYGLSQQYIDYLQLPKAANVEIYDIDKIIYSKKQMSTSDKIAHLETMRRVLFRKLQILQSGKKITDFNFLSFEDFQKQNGSCSKVEEAGKAIKDKNQIKRGNVQRKLKFTNNEAVEYKSDQSDQDQIQTRQKRKILKRYGHDPNEISKLHYKNPANPNTDMKTGAATETLYQENKDELINICLSLAQDRSNQQEAASESILVSSKPNETMYNESVNYHYQQVIAQLEEDGQLDAGDRPTPTGGQAGGGHCFLLGEPEVKPSSRKAGKALNKGLDLLPVEPITFVATKEVVTDQADVPGQPGLIAQEILTGQKRKELKQQSLDILVQKAFEEQKTKEHEEKQ